MIFGYARVSTKKQSLDMQLDELKRYGCEEIITEKESGAKKDRKELHLLLSKLRKDDTLVVYKLDRLGRTMHQLVNLLQEFNEKGIHFVSIKDGIDTSTTMGRFLFHIFGAMAEMEREVINERVISGVAAAKARGREGGRKKAHTSQQIQGMMEMLASGKTKVEVCEMFDVARATLYRYIKEHDSKQLVLNTEEGENE
ncbi:MULTISPECIES: recombinase family protein [Bacillus]|uniref:recombinase family protein n=1 Tax=Bacillus cereus group TaxID=86661 RepID=UPI0003029328|nr:MULTISPECIES: recombinase family protein [Bacillus cereus group]MCU5201252.1 recombinase family protein [Bacillus paranthracis]MDA2665534.1 recombinase family protein [Bacillus cereus group sp. Bc032]MDA2676320.1 recombinase family protein [Bacillus cereus group sp. Bc031]MDA2681834.1 recombinase family protein [Bacillus cereus group sp. Bc029]MDA2687290.1 recombinase family protein [Bacillus cereus group sp. Bc030]